MGSVLSQKQVSLVSMDVSKGGAAPFITESYENCLSLGHAPKIAWHFQFNYSVFQIISLSYFMNKAS